MDIVYLHVTGPTDGQAELSWVRYCWLHTMIIDPSTHTLLIIEVLC